MPGGKPLRTALSGPAAARVGTAESQRSHARNRVDGWVQVIRLNAEKQPDAHWRVPLFDLGLGGMAIRAAEPIEEGRFVLILVREGEPKGPSVFLGEVRWCQVQHDKWYRVGLRFRAIPEWMKQQPWWPGK